MTISQGLQQAYASVDNDGYIYDTIEITHIALPEPLYFVKGTPEAGSPKFITLPVAGAGMCNFTIIDFGLQRPGQEDGGITRARLRIDNVSQIIQGVLRDVIAADQAFEVTYRAYWSEDLNDPEVYTGLRMGQVAVTAYSAEGELFYDEVEMKAYPGEIYDISRFPSLFFQ